MRHTLDHHTGRGHTQTRHDDLGALEFEEEVEQPLAQRVVLVRGEFVPVPRYLHGQGGGAVELGLEEDWHYSLLQ